MTTWQICKMTLRCGRIQNFSYIDDREQRCAEEVEVRRSGSFYRNRRLSVRIPAIALISASLAWSLGWAPAASAKQSTCHGSTQQGRLENGVRLPLWGTNFQSYSLVASLLGRTYVHSKVREVVVSAYQALEGTAPAKVFVYGETGWRSGGRFSPHKTHQNGLSVDFMVPIVNKSGESVPLPSNPFNKMGYAIEFDGTGNYKSYAIDYESMAFHIASIHKAANAAGIKIWRVIFDPALQPPLFKTSQGEYLRRHIEFSRKPSWVRHDEHYHIDFDVGCEP